MNKKIRTALEGSIQKWSRIVKGTGFDYGSMNCPLCQPLLGVTDACADCPVQAKTALRACVGTPYQAWTDHMQTAHENPVAARVFCPRCRVIAQEELAFLQSLLPE